eukprot:364814-Chlamydomonas_euryale.AAC.10
MKTRVGEGGKGAGSQCKVSRACSRAYAPSPFDQPLSANPFQPTFSANTLRPPPFGQPRLSVARAP